MTELWNILLRFREYFKLLANKDSITVTIDYFIRFLFAHVIVFCLFMLAICILKKIFPELTDEEISNALWLGCIYGGGGW